MVGDINLARDTLQRMMGMTPSDKFQILVLGCKIDPSCLARCRRLRPITASFMIHRQYVRDPSNIYGRMWSEPKHHGLKMLVIGLPKQFEMMGHIISG